VINTPLEVGSELGWATFGGQQPFGVATQFYQFMVFNNPQWDWKTLNYDTDMAAVAKAENGIIDAKSTDLKRFVSRGGRMNPVPRLGRPADSVRREHELLRGRRQGDGREREGQLPPVHGARHEPLRRGDGPASFDMLTALEQWVEQKKVPDSIPAAHLTNGQPDRTRILCPYPQVATYKGSGDPNSAGNFACK
jgi:feruloyl esterase